MNNHKYSIGLVGALATISDAHLDAIYNNSSFELKGVCDLDRYSLLNKFSHLSDVVITTNYFKLLANEEIDAIVVCTPHHLHSTISVQALKMNKHVLCEKPMTISVKQSEEIFEAAENSTGIFVVSYHFEYFPEIEFFKSHASEFGEIKNFKFLSSEHLHPDSGWNYSSGTGGVWFDWAPNALSVLRKVLTKNNDFDNYRIIEAKLDGSLGYEIETDVYVKLLLDSIEGEIEIDWEADEGKFVAQTTFWNLKNDELKLDHASNCFYVNNKRVWSGKDLRYRKVYEDFSNRIKSRSSNIRAGIFETNLIASVFDY